MSVFFLSLDRDLLDLLLDLDLDRECACLLSLDLDLERDFERSRLLSFEDRLFTSLSSILSLLCFLCFLVLERSLLLELETDLDLLLSLDRDRERLLFLDVISGDLEWELLESRRVLLSLERERLEYFALSFSFRPCLRSRSGLLCFCGLSALLERAR